jgi:hypothetical protein
MLYREVLAVLEGLETVDDDLGKRFGVGPIRAMWRLTVSGQMFRSRAIWRLAMQPTAFMKIIVSRSGRFCQ